MALVAMAIGTLAAWLVLTQVMQSEWIWRPAILAGTALGGMLITVVFGFFGTWRSLNEKPARILRSE
ncbi:MAG: hypothetical protein R3360_08460, partial [Alphaproteobacteria bacterium]|nr:hypothetical protein [Alphaproteobacteria bacterium]